MNYGLKVVFYTFHHQDNEHGVGEELSPLCPTRDRGGMAADLHDGRHLNGIGVQPRSVG